MQFAVTDAEQVVRSNMRSFVASLPYSLAGELERYVAKKDRRRRKRALPQGPYWLLLPGWLAEKYKRVGSLSGLGQRGLSRILWAQYALYLAVRIHDDIADGQRPHGVAVFVADELLLEAERVLRGVIKDSPRFWNLYFRSLHLTFRGILEADALAQKPAIRPGQLLTAYANVAAIFKVGSAAVCALAGRWQEFQRISRYADELAKAGQIVDDLEDVLQDLRRGRFNFVSRLMGIDPRTIVDPTGLENLLADRMITRRCLKRVFNSAGRCCGAAVKSLQPLHLVPAIEFTVAYRRDLETLRFSLHHRTVQAIFGELLNPTSQQ